MFTPPTSDIHGTQFESTETETIGPSIPETASDGLRRSRALRRLALRLDLPTRWALAALGGWIMWRTRSTGSFDPWPWFVSGYAVIALITIGVWIGSQTLWEGRRARLWLFYGAYVADALFACVLIWHSGGLSSALYVLLLLLALKAAVLAQELPGMVWLPFSFGPLYAVTLRMASGNFAFLADPSFLARYLLMWIWLIGVVLVAWELAQRGARANALSTALSQQQAALAQKTEVLQRTATDLGDRVLELRSLQEVSKALASTLRLEETLQLIAERLRAVTGSNHCAVALVEGETVGTTWADRHLNGTLDTDIAEAQRIFRLKLRGEPETLSALRDDRLVRVRWDDSPSTPLRQLLGRENYLIMPLVSRGRPIGALYLTESPEIAPDGKTEQLVNSFAYFAATAIENARLYQDAWEKRRELEAVLAGIGDGVVVADPDLHLILMNPVARDILDLEEEPPAGVPLTPYLSSPAVVELLAKTLAGQQEVIQELDLEPGPPLGGAERDDRIHTYGVLASPVLDADGQVSGVVAVLRDITAQKELERMQSNFLSVVSHELRTPLHSIKGFVEIILMGKTGPVSELQEDFLKTVRAQTGVLQRMIDDLLEFSRMDAGRVKLHISEVSLHAVAHAVAAKLAPLAEEGGLQLFVGIPTDLPQIDGDRVRLEQVLTNLVENAIKFTPSGGKILIRAAHHGDHVGLTIADTGIGIPTEAQTRVFDRFFQVDGSERRAYRGTGLGLSICKHIVERHNGRIWVESDGQPGHGSQFHVELPVELHLAEAPTIDFTTSAR